MILQVDEIDITLTEMLKEEGEDLGKVIVDELASLLLKLDYIFNVPTRCIGEIIGDFQFITSSASAPLLKSIIQKTLDDHNCTVGELVITDLVNNICQLNPLSAAFSEGGPLRTAYQRNKYLNEHFSIVEPVECILGKGKSFQYIPILQSLSNLLQNSDIQEKLLTPNCSHSCDNRSFYDGSHFKENSFLSGKEFRLSLLMYCHDL